MAGQRTYYELVGAQQVAVPSAYSYSGQPVQRVEHHHYHHVGWGKVISLIVGVLSFVGVLIQVMVQLSKTRSVDQQVVITKLDPCAGAETHWASTQAENTIEAFEDHKRQFPTCKFSKMAERRIAALKSAAEAQPPTSPPELIPQEAPRIPPAPILPPPPADAPAQLEHRNPPTITPRNAPRKPESSEAPPSDFQLLPAPRVAPPTQPQYRPMPAATAWLGIRLHPNGSGGALVVSVHADSPAAAAGIMKGDWITAIDGLAISDADELARQIANVSPGTFISLCIFRNGLSWPVTLQLGSNDPSGAVEPSTPDSDHDDDQSTYDPPDEPDEDQPAETQYRVPETSLSGDSTPPTSFVR